MVTLLKIVKRTADPLIAPQHKNIFCQVQIHNLYSLLRDGGDDRHEKYHLDHESHELAHIVHIGLHHTATRLIHNFHSGIR